MKNYTFNFEIQTLMEQFVAAFNDVIVKRFDNTKTLIDPLSGNKVLYVYAPKQRVFNALNNPAPGGLTVPVIAVSIASITRDNQRVFNKNEGFNINYDPKINSEKLFKKIPQPVPINIGVNMTIVTKYQNDMEQIISNFVPYCDPYIVISWKLPSLSASRIPYEIRSEVLWNGTLNMQYPIELGPTQPFRVTADTSFTIKGWLFKKMDEYYKKIYTINSDFHDMSCLESAEYSNLIQDIDELYIQDDCECIRPPKPPEPEPTCIDNWTLINFNGITFRNGDPIPQATNSTEWEDATTNETPCWCYYDFDSNNESIYGKLYNWYVANDVRGIGPEGYIVPSESDFTTLETCLGGNAIAGGKMKTTGTIQDNTGLWDSPNAEATNESGFSVIPSGYMSDGGSSDLINKRGTFWTTTGLTCINFNNNASYVYHGPDSKGKGYSIRLKRGTPTPPPPPPANQYFLFDKTSFVDASVPEPYLTYLNQAADRWSTYIKFNPLVYDAITLGNPAWSGIKLQTYAEFNDPTSGTIAAAGPRLYYDIQPTGVGVQFNTISFALSTNKFFESAIPAGQTTPFDSQDWINILTHELGHALGIGIYWNSFFEPEGAVPPEDNFLDGTKYTLTQLGYNSIVSDTTYKKTPLEDSGGAGTESAHWEDNFRPSAAPGANCKSYYGLSNELMVGTYDKGMNVKISQLSIGFLVDIGYQEVTPGSNEGIPDKVSTLTMSNYTSNNSNNTPNISNKLSCNHDKSKMTCAGTIIISKTENNIEAKLIKKTGDDKI